MKVFVFIAVLLAWSVSAFGDATPNIQAFQCYSGTGGSICAGSSHDKFYVNGVVFSKPSGKPTMTITNAGSMNSIDATSGNQTFMLPAGGVAVVCKIDSTANTVTITPSVGGQTSALGPLSVQGECATLGLAGTTWLRQ